MRLGLRARVLFVGAAILSAVALASVPAPETVDLPTSLSARVFLPLIGPVLVQFFAEREATHGTFVPSSTLPPLPTPSARATPTATP